MKTFFKHNKKILIGAFLLFFPVIILAQGLGDPVMGQIPEAPHDFKSLICIMVFLALDFVPYIIVIAVGAFLTGLIKYISHGDNEEKRAEGNKMMIYGLLGFFFMFSVWGILGLFTNSFGLGLLTPQFKQSDTGSVPGCFRTLNT